MPFSTVLTVHRYKPGAAMLPEPIPFPFLSADDLVVTRIAALTAVRTVLTSGYVISGDGEAKAGTIRTTLPWPADDVIEVARQTALTQEADVVPHQPLPAREMTRQFDRMAMAAQERKAEGTDTALRALMALPGQALRAIDKRFLRGKLLGGDAGGDIVPITMRDSGGIDTLATLIDPAAGSKVVAHWPLGGGPALALGGFLDRFGHWVEDEAGIQQANDLIVASGDRQLIQNPPGATIMLSAGVLIDAAMVAFESNGAVLNALGMTTGAAITLTGSIDPPYRQNANELRLPELIGPGTPRYVNGALVVPDVTALTVDGVLLHREGDGPNGFGPSHLRIVAPNISGFKHGMVFRNRAYLNKIQDGSIFGCDYCIWQDEAQDGQENNQFIRTTLFNSRWAVKMTTDKADLHLTSCSKDTLARLFDVHAGTLYINDAHGEVVGSSTYEDTPVMLGGDFARVFWDGGSRRVPAGPKRFPYWVDGPGGTFVDQCFDAIGDMTSTGAFAGPAITLLRPGRIAGNETRDNCYMANIAVSRVPDPQYSSLGVNGEFVQPSTGLGYGLIDRFTDAYSGTTTTKLTVAGGKLIATKTIDERPAAKVSRYVVLMFDADPQELIGGVITLDKPGNESGTIFVSAAWARIDDVPNGPTPAITRADVYAAQSIVLPATPVAGLKIKFQPMGSHRSKPWPNRWMLIVNADGVGAGALHWSNANFDRVG